ncbi:MAG: protein phosphatase 2C domain-containing protein [Clostridia bacterium]|nr:protein phosphatase 2C domain-containing protein [Clostridia bacterium]
MECHYYQKTGAYHAANNAPCEDAVLAVEDSEYALIALADGVTACRHGKAGAQKAVEALWDYIQLERDHIFTYSPQKTSWLLLEHVLYYLELESWKENSDVAEFSSTLAFACIEKKTGRAITGNLGDGIVCGFLNGAYSAPTGPARPTNRPFLTTTQYAYKAMTLQYPELFLEDCIILGSDGFMHAVRALKDNNRLLCKTAEQFDFSELDQCLAQYPEPDDCSYIAIKRSRENIGRS